MRQLSRIYWTRQGLRLAYSAVMLWLATAVMTALMPKAGPAAGAGTSSPAEVLRGLVDCVFAAAVLPGVFAVVLMLVAAVVSAGDVRRRDPVRRFTRQQRREGMARAGGQCELEVDATGRNGPGFRRRGSSNGWNDDGGTTFRPTLRSGLASGSGCRS